MQLKLIHEIHSVGVVFHADSESEIRLSLSLTERKFCRLRLQKIRNLKQFPFSNYLICNHAIEINS